MVDSVHNGGSVVGNSVVGNGVGNSVVGNGVGKGMASMAKGSGVDGMGNREVGGNTMADNGSVSTTDRTKMKAFVISALLGLAAAAPAQVSHVSHVAHHAVAHPVAHHAVAHHAAPLVHAVHAAPIVHAAPAFHAPVVVAKELPEPYTYTYGVADDYSK